MTTFKQTVCLLTPVIDHFPFIPTETLTTTDHHLHRTYCRRPLDGNQINHHFIAKTSSSTTVSGLKPMTPIGKPHHNPLPFFFDRFELNGL